MDLFTYSPIHLLTFYLIHIPPSFPSKPFAYTNQLRYNNNIKSVGWEKPQRSHRKSKQRGRTMNKNQSVGMYVILGIMVLAFISMLFSGPTSSTEELSYTNFLQKVENKEIKSVYSQEIVALLADKIDSTQKPQHKLKIKNMIQSYVSKVSKPFTNTVLPLVVRKQKSHQIKLQPNKAAPRKCFSGLLLYVYE